jgi:hypothetical protein
MYYALCNLKTNILLKCCEFFSRTIFYISIVYAIGNVVIAFASTTGAIELPAR